MHSLHVRSLYASFHLFGLLERYSCSSGYSSCPHLWQHTAEQSLLAFGRVQGQVSHWNTAGCRLGDHLVRRTAARRDRCSCSIARHCCYSSAIAVRCYCRCSARSQRTPARRVPTVAGAARCLTARYACWRGWRNGWSGRAKSVIAVRQRRMREQTWLL